MTGVVESYKHLGPVALGVFWICTGFLVWRFKLGKSTSISGHVAANKTASIAFGIVSLLVMPFLIIYFLKWFTPTFHFNWAFNLIIIAIWLLYFVAGVVPDTKDLAHQIHVKTALIASVLLVPAMVFMIANNHIGTFARIFMVIGLIMMFVSGRELRKSNYSSDKFLIYQAVYFLSFDLSIIFATYIR